MTVKERLTAYLANKKINKSEFGRTIGVSNAYVSSIRKSIDADKLQAIALNYPDLNLEWLLTGTGDMLKRDEAKIPNIKGNIIYGNNSTYKDLNLKGTYHEGTADVELLLKEIEMLRKENELLKDTVKDKERLIKVLMGETET